MFSLSGAAGNGGGVIWLVPGLIALIVGIILVSPFFLALLARVGRQIAHRHPPAPARHGALPGPLRLGPLGHQPRHHDRGHHLRRRRRPLLQRLRLRRARTCRRTRSTCTRPPTAGTTLRSQRARRRTQPAPEPLGAGGDDARHRLRGRCDERGRARQPGRRSAESERCGPAVGRPDLRGHARTPAGLRHQPVVHPVQRRHPQLAARAGRLGRAADLRQRRQGGRRLRGPGWRREQHQPVHAQPVPRPPRGPGGEPAAHRARRHRTR